MEPDGKIVGLFCQRGSNVVFVLNQLCERLLQMPSTATVRLEPSINYLPAAVYLLQGAARQIAVDAGPAVTGRQGAESESAGGWGQ